MKKLLLCCTFLFTFEVFADIAPNPIVVKGIYTTAECKVQMISEKVYADLYIDSARVDCSFDLINHGDSVSMEIGFPEMNFQYWSMGQYSVHDRSCFKILVDGQELNQDQIGVPQEFDSLYRVYMQIYKADKEYSRKIDSVYESYGLKKRKDGTYMHPGYLYKPISKALDDLREWRKTEPDMNSEIINQYRDLFNEGIYPWYVWKVHFEKGEKKNISVIYSLPSGMGYGANYRYFNYVLNTGAGWYKDIEKADIFLKLHDIDPKYIEEIKPEGYIQNTDEHTIIWNLKNIEPTSEDDIYFRYYDKKERRRLKRRSRRF